MYIYTIIKNRKVIYSLDCNYFDEEFDTMSELVDYVIYSGMDPNWEITIDGEPSGEQIIDLLDF